MTRTLPRYHEAIPADQPAAADGNQHGVDVAGLTGQFESECALAEEGLTLIERVYLKRPGLSGPRLAGGQRLWRTVHR